MKKLPKTTGNRGFTIIELSVVLVIIAIVTIGFFEGNVVLLHRNRISATKKKMDVIQQAILNYVMENDNLPCPAGLHRSTADSTFGQAVTNCDSLSSTDNVNGVFVDGVDSNIIQGAIPVVDLGLPFSSMRDEWGDKISYILDKRYTADFPEMDMFIYAANPGELLTINSEGMLHEVTDKAVYVIISHGTNRFGSFIYDGDLQNDFTNAITEERRNIFQDASYDNNIIYSLYDVDFDDIVKYKTKLQLILDLDWEDIGCFINTEIAGLNNPDPSNCEAFLAPVDSFLDFYEELEATFTGDSDKCCIAKCYKYGRLGFFVKNESCSN